MARDARGPWRRLGHDAAGQAAWITGAARSALSPARAARRLGLLPAGLHALVHDRDPRGALGPSPKET